MTDDPRDADPALTRLVRAGDERAVTELYERHHPAVLAFARRLCQDPHTAEDLASESFARTLRTVRNGSGGPSEAWRPYLYAVARNTAIEWARSQQRIVLTEEFREDELTTPPPEPPDDLVTRAYRSLPPRWQTVLWHTLIEEEEPERVARILGVTPGNVGVLAFRAREGLRKAYLAAHVAGASPRCLQYAEPLAAIVRKRSDRLPRGLRTHLSTCASCARAHAELRDLNATLRAAVPVALLPLALKAAEWTTTTATTLTPAASASKGVVAGKGGALSLGGGVPGWVVPVVGAAVVVAAAVGGVILEAAPAPPVAVPTAGPPSAASSPADGTTPTSMRRPTRTPSSVVTSTAGPTATAGPRATVSPTTGRARTPAQARRSAGTPTRTATPTAAAQAGARLVHASRCVGAAGAEVAALPCADPRTAWRTRGPAQRFQLVNVVTGRCLAAGEQYDTTAFNGGGMLAVRLRPCASVPVQRWHRPTFSDGVRRLVSVPSGKALSIGKEFVGKRPPTAFILYGPYTGSADQSITFADG
ncbi:sigma-70 family RNA polymerase sigma factor [Nonomuraea wenchangensis]|uniref:RNA polymerase sigma factor, sigma-70 family n=1 Tax=Nonomuraea wenchangensis TaxID=568860 RepID=A0A1I0KDC4_9ACTN|nr:sigma-70 family RNA polymerase sigma factor [Nonomuraea wenchangensis]SEU22367.1 RNA polymerase sigma factor, sigma-70 family [Nonomuraea wenchangensis]